MLTYLLCLGERALHVQIPTVVNNARWRFGASKQDDQAVVVGVWVGVREGRGGSETRGVLSVIKYHRREYVLFFLFQVSVYRNWQVVNECLARVAKKAGMKVRLNCGRQERV